jgi:hypothetical protein
VYNKEAVLEAPIAVTLSVATPVEWGPAHESPAVRGCREFDAGTDQFFPIDSGIHWA